MSHSIVFWQVDSGPDPISLTHAVKDDGDHTLCGILIPNGAWGDIWADGPECKRCIRKLGQAAEAGVELGEGVGA